MPALELQSGFVVAVIIAALFLADRLQVGVLQQRICQAALAIGLVLTVAAFTEAAVPSPNLEDLVDDFEALEQAQDPQEVFDVTQETANDDDLRAMIQFAAGIGLVVAGMLAIGRFPVLSGGALFGGLLVLLAAGSQGGSDALSELLDFVIGDAASDAGYDWARFVVFLAGTLILLWTGYTQFEEPLEKRPASVGPSTDPSEPPAGRDPFANS